MMAENSRPLNIRISTTAHLAISCLQNASRGARPAWAAISRGTCITVR